MSSETLYEAPRKRVVQPIRVHDYLYDSAYIVSGARDYARTAFRAAMASAQLGIQPVFKNMFSELRQVPRMQVVYHPNCRLPNHLDRSYGAYLRRVADNAQCRAPDCAGKDRFKFCAFPKKVLQMKSVSVELRPPSPAGAPRSPGRPKNKGTQSVYRESSAQTRPWQPDGKAADTCATTPEILYLDKLEWGPGDPYRAGDLPADFHTTEIINKMRHARIWMEVVERNKNPRWMKSRDAIIGDVEVKDWIFREAEIDELQNIRLTLLHKMQTQHREDMASKTKQRLAARWANTRQDMERKVDLIRRTRDRELRKLSAIHSGGGRLGQVQNMRASRGGGSVTKAAADPTSDLYAPVARNGYQARRRHAEIIYDPSLLMLEDHMELSNPPAWLEQCGRDLTKTCSGHHLPRDPMTLCQRETKWSESFLENLHNDLKKARLGAATTSVGPLHILKPRRLQATPRPGTPCVESVQDSEEAHHQAALLMQKIIRGRAVQCLMYEGRMRAAELTEELKTTHGLQLEDKMRIAREEAKAREYGALRTEAEQREDAITALVDELCGGAVAAALDFLEKELRRLKEERRQHAFVLVALREKSMREAAEAGRRQKEEHRRREHDEIFKQIVGATQETVDAYLRSVMTEGVALGAEEEASRRATVAADHVEETVIENEGMGTAEQNELVAELVQQFLLPHTHKEAARHRLASLQEARLSAARDSIFGLLDDAEIREKLCTQCGVPLGALCRCEACPSKPAPQATFYREDPRWKKAAHQTKPEKTMEEKWPPAHDFRCMLDTLVDEAVTTAREQKREMQEMKRELAMRVREGVEATLDAKGMAETMFKEATGDVSPKRDYKYHHFMKRYVGDALRRTVPFEKKPCPAELPSEIRRKELEVIFAQDPTCRCEDPHSKVTFGLETMTKEQVQKLLPSELRVLEDMRRCKCDSSTEASAADEPQSDIVEPAYQSSYFSDEYKDEEAPDNIRKDADEK